VLLVYGTVNLDAQENTVQVNAPNAPGISAALEHGEIPVGENGLIIKDEPEPGDASLTFEY